MPFQMVPITSSNSIDKGVIWGGGDFLQFSPKVFNRFDFRFLLIPPKALLWFRILQQYMLFKWHQFRVSVPLQTVTINGLREKGRDLTQSHDQSPYTSRNVKGQRSSITQRLRTDLGRSVGVTTATQLMWLTWFTGPTFPLPATAV